MCSVGWPCKKKLSEGYYCTVAATKSPINLPIASIFLHFLFPISFSPIISLSFSFHCREREPKKEKKRTVMNCSAHFAHCFFFLLLTFLFILFCNFDFCSHKDSTGSSSLSHKEPSFLAHQNQILTANLEKRQQYNHRRRKLLMHGKYSDAL